MSRTIHARDSASATLGSIETCWPCLLDVGEPVQPGVCDCEEECGLVAPVLPLGGRLPERRRLHELLGHPLRPRRRCGSGRPCSPAGPRSSARRASRRWCGCRRRRTRSTRSTGRRRPSSPSRRTPSSRRSSTRSWSGGRALGRLARCSRPAPPPPRWVRAASPRARRGRRPRRAPSAWVLIRRPGSRCSRPR